MLTAMPVQEALFPCSAFKQPARCPADSRDGPPVLTPARLQREGNAGSCHTMQALAPVFSAHFAAFFPLYFI